MQNEIKPNEDRDHPSRWIMTKDMCYSRLPFKITNFQKSDVMVTNKKGFTAINTWPYIEKDREQFDGDSWINGKQSSLFAHIVSASQTEIIDSY